MTALLTRAFHVVEHLAAHPAGLALSTLASALDIPLSATHRLLADLIAAGYVRQDAHDGHYRLTIKLVSVGLSFLSASGVVDIAQPLLDRLAAEAGELVRLAVVDGDDLIFVAKAQGATRGLRYDPDMGLSVALSCSAAGHAWLSTMDDDAATALLSRKGLARREDHGPKAPTTLKAVLAFVRAARRRGYSTIDEVFAPGMSAMAAPIIDARRRTLGVVTIAGPAIRLNAQRMLELAPELIATAREMAGASGASALFRRG